MESPAASLAVPTRVISVAWLVIVIANLQFDHVLRASKATEDQVQSAALVFAATVGGAKLLAAISAALWSVRARHGRTLIVAGAVSLAVSAALQLWPALLGPPQVSKGGAIVVGTTVLATALWAYVATPRRGIWAVYVALAIVQFVATLNDQLLSPNALTVLGVLVPSYFAIALLPVGDSAPEPAAGVRSAV